MVGCTPRSQNPRCDDALRGMMYSEESDTAVWCTPGSLNPRCDAQLHTAEYFGICITWLSGSICWCPWIDPLWRREKKKFFFLFAVCYVNIFTLLVRECSKCRNSKTARTNRRISNWLKDIITVTYININKSPTFKFNFLQQKYLNNLIEKITSKDKNIFEI